MCWAAITPAKPPGNYSSTFRSCRNAIPNGVQRVDASILRELLENPPKGYVVEPVYALPDGSGYRYARRFIVRFRGADERSG